MYLNCIETINIISKIGRYITNYLVPFIISSYNFFLSTN